MYKVEPKNYTNYIQYIDKSSCGMVYPYSIVKHFQQGDIFSIHHSFLYRHYCGFTFLYGVYDENSLESTYDLLFNNRNINPKRSILFVTNEAAERFFRIKNNIVIQRRYFFEYKKDCPTVIPDLPVGYEICEMDYNLLRKINGNITPALFWGDVTYFLEKGKGFCIIDGNNVAAWAFTAAISDEEIDIGIETNREYQRIGLAYIVAGQMIRYCFDQRKRPVWACHSENIASRKLAEKLGFVKTSECWTVKKLNK
ncbi:MAG: GNAT family N-acetyltransferase [Oscillospiraceae bacterium]|nr:GNAT family N-acetyltransferase [Oscillospiraceae bacterium]